MVRTQLYLGEKQKAKLASLARSRHISIATLIRKAIDRLIKPGNDENLEALRNACGLWRDRKESGTAYTRRIRSEWGDR